MQLIITFFLVSLIVALVATVFITIVNIRKSKDNIQTLDFQTLVTNLLVFSVWVMIGLEWFSTETIHGQIRYGILFFLAIALGIALIICTREEILLRTRMHALLTKLNTTNIRLRELDAQKSEFISLISHQLRGPLTSIKGYTTMLLEGDFGAIPKKLSEPIHRIFASSQSLGSLINDFLDVSKLEKGELQYNIKPFNIVTVLDDVVADFNIMITQAGLTCVTTYNTTDVITVLGDMARTRQVLMKILDNAVKYTPMGSITISIATKQHDAIVSISDTGIGVRAEDIPDMFKKFKRTQNAAALSVTGSGLGLYVAKEMIEAQGGHMWVDSQGQNKGTRFFITLPLRD